jgi:predicted SprT family Zn-dependent metalloprotease
MLLVEEVQSGTTESEETKRGRKIKSNNYFDVREETAVVMFLQAQTMKERNEIYNQYLKKPIEKMVSSIIRRYKLYRKDMSLQNQTNLYQIRIRKLILILVRFVKTI